MTDLKPCPKPCPRGCKDVTEICHHCSKYEDGKCNCCDYKKCSYCPFPRKMQLIVYRVWDGMRTNDLKPCPFCGSTEIRFAYYSDHWIVCENCGGSSGMFSSYEKAASMWNRRVKE